MAILNRLLVLFPLVLTLVAFVLSFLVLFSGHKEGFMEDYAIARLNTSMLGQNMIETDRKDDTSTDDNDDGGFLDSLTDKVADKWNDVKNDIADEINNITGDIADELADTLGISEWYSIHVMDACQGTYKPNATSPGAGLNVTNCTESSVDQRFNLTEMLDHELGVGPFQLNLADLNWPDEIQEGLDALNKALLGLFIVYVLAIGFSGLAMFGCALYFIWNSKSIIAVTNLALTSLAALCMTIGSIIATVAASKGVEKVNDHGDDIGLSASVGHKFITITWIAAGFMIGASAYWAVEFCLVRKRNSHKRHGHEKEMEYAPRGSESAS